MKIIKSANYKKFIKAQFDRIRNGDDLEFEQNASISNEVDSYLISRLNENPHISFTELFRDAKYNFIDDSDYDTAAEYATMTERIITKAVQKLERQKHEAEDADSQASFEAEMGRDTYQQHGDGYQAMEDISPCKDPNDNLRSNGKPKSHQGYPNLEKTDYYPPIV